MTAATQRLRIATYLATCATAAAIPPPPSSVLAQPLTPQIVASYPVYYLTGAGRALAEATRCSHGYRLTDSCPCC